MGLLAYSKSIALLYDQTKLMLNEPFYTTEECNNLNWPNDTRSLDEDEIWDNEDIRSVLRKFIPNVRCTHTHICSRFSIH